MWGFSGYLRPIEIEQMTSGSGVYSIFIPPTSPNRIIVGTYNGLNVVTCDFLVKACVEHRTDFEHGARWILQDSTDTRLWIASPFRGVSRISFDEDYSEIVEQQAFDRDLPANARWMPEQINGQLTVVANGKMHRFDEELMGFVPFQNQHTKQATFMKAISSGESTDFYVHDRFVQLVEDNKVRANLSLVLEESSRSIFTLEEGRYFFCLDEGYAIYQDKEGLYEEPAWLPSVRAVKAFDKKGVLIKSYELLQDDGKEVVIPNRTSTSTTGICR